MIGLLNIKNKEIYKEEYFFNLIVIIRRARAWV